MGRWIRSVVFREVGARYMNLGIDGINSRKEMLLVTLLLFSPARLHALMGRLIRLRITLELDTIKSHTVQGPGHHMCPCYSGGWIEQAKWPCTLWLGSSTSELSVSSTIWFFTKRRDDTHDSEKSCQHLEVLHGWKPSVGRFICT